MDVLPLLQVQVQLAVAATFSLATAGIRNAGFAHTTEARNHVAPVRLLHELFLNCPQQFVGSATELVEPSPEGPRFNEYHLVILPQCGRRVPGRIPEFNGFGLSLANETKRLHSFVRKFLTKRWFCNGDANQTEQPPRDLCPQDLQGRVFPGLCAPASAPGSAAS